MDGIGLFDAAQREELLANYAHPFAPDLDGAYLMRAFHFLRDQYLFFPWYDRTPGAWRGTGLRSAAELHAWLIEVLKANETYPLAYRAAFGWEAAVRLPLVTQPVLFTAPADDPLFDSTKRACALVGGSRFAAQPKLDDLAFGEARVELIAGFFR